MKTNFWRVLLAFLAAWVLAPLLVAVGIGLATGLGDPRPGETLLDPVLKMLIYGVIIGLPYSLVLMLVVVAPAWFLLHRRRVRRRGFMTVGGLVGAGLGLIFAAPGAFRPERIDLLLLVLTILIPAAVGALCAFTIHRIAYGRATNA